MHACMFSHNCIHFESMYVRMDAFVCMYAFGNVCVYECMYACISGMYAYMHTCIYANMLAWFSTDTKGCKCGHS